MQKNTENTIRAAREYFGIREFISEEYDYQFTWWYRQHYDGFNPANISTIRKFTEMQIHSEWINCGDEYEEYSEEVRFYCFV